MTYIYRLSIVFFMATGVLLGSETLSASLFKQVAPRAIGPAGMSGRVTSIAVSLKNPDIIYVGAASGGLWRSIDGGVKWEPLFDKQPVQSIGAVALDPNNPDVIWVGTGEGNPRNSQNSGAGIFKSIDGGKNWQRMGLVKTRTIHRIIINPQNSSIVYAASLGSAWGPNKERGVFKTRDGGKSWKKVLFVNDSTGCADLVMDPANPEKLVAAMWQYQRWPWFFNSGGKGSGLYVSYDGGENWQKRTEKDGLPAGELGRIGLAIAPSNPKRIYALVEAKKTALYRSDDGGFKWKKISDKNIGNRPFYYADIFVDPQNDNRLYNLYSIVTVSEDGGKTFETLIPWNKVHPDHHAWWAHPDDPSFLIDGNDGGLAISRDRGKSWRFVENLPLAQFYHINVDDAHPYHIYGGMQDNGSWIGPAYVWRNSGIRNLFWQELSFGDGFDVVPDPKNNRYGYSMWQEGNLLRYDRLTGNNTYIQPTHPGGIPLRFHWNAGIAVDPIDRETLYFGSQFLHKSTDKGMSWQIISPDLTTNDPGKQKQLQSGGLSYDVTGAENHTTIITIAPSPLKAGVIWAGTDDGNVQLTRDGGKSWTNTSGNMPGLPRNAWIAQIRASRHKPGAAFVVVNNYRQNDWKPYLYQTDNWGKKWKRLIDEQDMDSYLLSFWQDAKEPRLMFAGSETGLYFSMNSGKNWQKWTEGYPSAPTMDIAWQPQEDDLIVGTFGRAAWVFDRIAYLRFLTRNQGREPSAALAVMPASPAWIAAYAQPPGTRFIAEAEFEGQNRPRGAMLTAWLKVDSSKTKKTKGPKKQDEGLIIEIFDAGHTLIRTLKPKKLEHGFNRFYWNLDQKGVRMPQTPEPQKDKAVEPGGAPVLPGTYLARFSYRGMKDSVKIEVKADPRIAGLTAKLKEKQELFQKFKDLTQKGTRLADAIRKRQSELELAEKAIEVLKPQQADSLKKKTAAVRDSLKALMHKIVTPADKQGIYRDPEVLTARLGKISAYLRMSFDTARATVLPLMQQAAQKTDTLYNTYNRTLKKIWPGYRRDLEEADIKILPVFKTLEN